MSLRLILHPAARSDLADIWQWTAKRWGIQQAEAYLNGLRKAFDLLRGAPEMSRERHEISPPVRLQPYRSHLVIYRVNEDALTVHRVVHARSNWQNQFSD